jgi:hypothetical protein
MQLVATIKNVAGWGTFGGAVYKPFRVMVPNPVIGAATLAIVHPFGPCPAVHSVGGMVVEGVAGGSQICQNTVEVEAPVTLAANCAGWFTMIVSGDCPGPEIVIPTAVELPPQLAPSNIARSITAPSPQTLMCFPPAISARFSARAAQ